MRCDLDYRPLPARSPLTPWVHTGVDGPYWTATRFDPPMPSMVHGKGYPVWILRHRGREIVFCSPEEIGHAIDCLGQRVMPRSRDLGRPHRAVNSHWLSRLHKSWKPWKVRQEMVRRLRAAPQP
jgi:hypothetical protein